jgi:hypothetical protein
LPHPSSSPTFNPNPRANINKGQPFYSSHRYQRMVFLNCCSHPSYIPTSSSKYTVDANSETAYVFVFLSRISIPLGDSFSSHCVLLLTHRGGVKW